MSREGRGGDGRKHSCYLSISMVSVFTVGLVGCSGIVNSNWLLWCLVLESVQVEGAWNNKKKGRVDEVPCQIARGPAGRNWPRLSHGASL